MTKEFADGYWYQPVNPWVWYSPRHHSLVVLTSSNSSMYIKLGPKQEQAVRESLERSK